MTTDITKYGDDAMFEAVPMASNRPKAHLLWATPDPLGALAAAWRMYEGKPTYDLNDITDNERRSAWDESMSTHLKAPFEFVKMHFFIEGVTRAWTHQMVRQRTAVYAQESLRFAVKSNLSDEVTLPVTIREGSDEAEAWERAVEFVDQQYNYLIAQGVPAEDARGLLPHAVTTRMNYCTDLRALADHAGNRLCTQAQFEWRFVFSEIVQAIRTYRYQVEAGNRWQFKLIADSILFRPVCYKLGHCPFGATIDRPCKIRDRVQAGKFEEIDPSEWLLDPMAARSVPGSAQERS